MAQVVHDLPAQVDLLLGLTGGDPALVAGDLGHGVEDLVGHLPLGLTSGRTDAGQVIMRRLGMDKNETFE